MTCVKLSKFPMEICTSYLLGRKGWNSISLKYRGEENHTKYTVPFNSDEEGEMKAYI